MLSGRPPPISSPHHLATLAKPDRTAALCISHQTTKSPQLGTAISFPTGFGRSSNFRQCPFTRKSEREREITRVRDTVWGEGGEAKLHATECHRQCGQIWCVTIEFNQFQGPGTRYEVVARAATGTWRVWRVGRVAGKGEKGAARPKKFGGLLWWRAGYRLCDGRFMRNSSVRRTCFYEAGRRERRLAFAQNLIITGSCARHAFIGILCLPPRNLAERGGWDEEARSSYIFIGGRQYATRICSGLCFKIGRSLIDLWPDGFSRRICRWLRRWTAAPLLKLWSTHQATHVFATAELIKTLRCAHLASPSGY